MHGVPRLKFAHPWVKLQVCRDLEQTSEAQCLSDTNSLSSQVLGQQLSPGQVEGKNHLNIEQLKKVSNE